MQDLQEIVNLVFLCLNIIGIYKKVLIFFLKHIKIVVMFII